MLKAVDRLEGTTVALKVLSILEPEHIQRFKNEFLLLRRLDHPNIVRVYDFGFGSAGEPYFSMEYVEGQEWNAFLRPLDYSRFWPVILRICSTLDFLHCKRIIHGDLKPSNILITTSSQGEVIPKFTDFGFAELGRPEESAWWKGTVCYLAPEIIRGEKYGHQSDLYSLGVLIYESVFGRRPFEEEELMELAKSHLEKEVVIPNDPSVPRGLKDLILKLLEKDPMDRYFSADDVARQLEKISGLSLPDKDSSLARSLISSGDFTGRESQLSALKETFRQASTQGKTLVLLSGESGVGKTRLLQEFGAWAELEGALVARIAAARASSIRTSLESTLGLLETSSSPTILVMENLEQADDLSFELVCDSIRQAANKKGLFCMTVRNDLTRSEKDKRARYVEDEIKSRFPEQVRVLKLERLSEGEQKQLVSSMFTWKEKGREILEVMHRKAEGNPILIRRLLESLADDDRFGRQNGGWTVQLELIEGAAAPRTLTRNIEDRLNRLNQDELNLLELASVLGLEFQIHMLEQLSGLDPGTFNKCVQNILAERILVPSEAGSDSKRIRFLNGFSRDLIHHRIDSSKVQGLHRSIATYLEQRCVSGPENYADQLAEHYYRAADNELALKYAVLAAETTENLADRARAITHYLRALELWEDSSSPHAMPKDKLLRSLGNHYEADGRYKESIRCFQEALDLIKRGKAVGPDAVRTLTRMARIYGKTGKHQEASSLLHKALEITSQRESSEEYLSVLIDLAWEKRTTCEYEQALGYLEQAISALQERLPSKEAGAAFNCMAGVYWSLGDYARALENLSQSLDVFEQLGDVEQIADCYIARGLLLRSKGLPNQALEDSQKALALVEKLSDPYRLSVLENNLGIIYMDLNRWDSALECFSKNSELKRQLSDLKGLALSHNNIGLIYLKKGLFDRSFEQFTSALKSFQELRDRSGAALVYHNLADLHRCKQEHGKAARYLEKSLRTAGEIGEESRLADCLLLSGKVAMEQSELAQAEESLDRAAHLYAKGRNNLGEAEAQLALAELSLRSGDLDRAKECLGKVQLFTQSADNKWIGGYFSRVSAQLSKSRGDREGCLQNLLQAVTIFKTLGARHELAKSYLELGKVKLETGRTREGKAFICEALSVFEKSGVEAQVKEAKALLATVKDAPHLEKERVRTFYRLADILNSVWDTEELLTKALELVIELLNAERGAIILYSERDKSFEVKVSRGLEPETSEDAIAISRRVLTDVIKSDSPLIVDNATSNPQFARSESVVMYNILSILCVPLRTGNRLIGTVYLDHRSLPAVFSSEDVDFLKAFSSLIATAIEKSELYVRAHEQIFQLKGVLQQYYQYPHIVGKSAKMLEIFNLVEKVADSKTSVLVFGESGTGKELIAHLIHERSQKGEGPFVRVNCAALPESILESELFGIEEKAATGVGFRKGKFELAHGGTIFLDEIGDMSLSVQAKVLRVLQEKEFERVGGQRPIKVDIRIISATNMDLQKKVENGTFRLDLFYRLNPIVINIPPLRERKDDIPSLVQYFVKKYAEENGKPEIKVTKKILTAVQNYSWPGNVRELEHLIERATLLSENGEFPQELLPQEAQVERALINLDRYGKLQEVLDWVEKRWIAQALERNRWNQVRAAQELGLNETTLRRRIKKHRIRKPGKFKSS